MSATASTPTTTDIWFAGTLMRVLADHALTNGQFALIEQRAPQGFSPPTHVHQYEDQFFYVLEGQITARLGDDERVLGPGDTAWLPRGIAHTFRVDSAEARLLEVSTPAGFEQFHVELGEPRARCASLTPHHWMCLHSLPAAPATAARTSAHPWGRPEPRFRHPSVIEKGRVPRPSKRERKPNG